MADFNNTFFGRRRDNRYIAEENPPFLDPRYSYFARMNITTITFTAIHTLVMLLIVLLRYLPQSDSIPDFTRVLIGQLIPVFVGFSLFLYDLFYSSQKIIRRDLANYGIDFVFFGLLGSIFGWLVGIYLLIKGLIVMVIALTDRAVFAWRYNKTFREIWYSFGNKFASGLGFIILIIRNPFLMESREGLMVYYYLAWGALLADFFILRYLVNRHSIGEVPIWIAVLKLLLGVTACFYQLAGIILVFEGIIMVFNGIWRYQPANPR